MGGIPDGLISAIADDLRRETGFNFEFYNSLPSRPPDFSHSMSAAYSLVKSIGKKFIPTDTTNQDKAALDKFLAANRRCEAWEFSPVTSGDEELIGSVKTEIENFFYPRGYPLLSSLDQIFLNGRNGSGAALGADGGDFYTKLFSSHLTSGSSILVDHYKYNVRRWPEWGNAEIIRTAHFGEPRIVDSSRLSFVPKNDKISRTICTEPVLGMFYQLGIGSILTSRLRTMFGIDMATEADVNRALARSGSISGSWSTIDLESASDSIAYKMCKFLLPKEVFYYFDLARSKATSYKGTAHELHMISSMGNGFTFPLQTVIFACVVKSVYVSLGLPFLKGSRVSFGVFGDDIVIYRAAWDRVIRILSLLGFTVNTDKSFCEGPFRESCGRDYLNGRNIRGVYLRRLEQPQDFFSAINAFNVFSARTGLRFPSVMNWLTGRVDRSIEVPCWEDPSSGIILPLRYVKTKRMNKQTWGISYTRYVPRRKFIRIGKDYVHADQKGRRRIYNPSGLLIALLSGEALSSGLPVRSEQVEWKKKRGSCSYWDSLPSDPALLSGFDWRQFETAVYENLFS